MWDRYDNDSLRELRLQVVMGNDWLCELRVRDHYDNDALAELALQEVMIMTRWVELKRQIIMIMNCPIELKIVLALLAGSRHADRLFGQGRQICVLVGLRMLHGRLRDTGCRHRRLYLGW